MRELLLQIPQNVERVYWARAYVAWLDGLYEEAANWYIKYFDHNYPQNDPPSPSEFVYQFGIMYDYRCSLQWSELETIFTQRWPEIFGTYIIQGWNYLFKGDSESAQIAFSKVTNDSEEAWIAHFGLGVTYANEKNGKAAVKCFEKALLSSEWAQKFMLAVEKGSKDLVVIELKRNESDDEVVGQISRYMAWVKRNLAKEGQVVKGIICVHKALKKLVLSASNIPGLMVYEYDFNFRIATIS